MRTITAVTVDGVEVVVAGGRHRRLDVAEELRSAIASAVGEAVR